LGSLAGPVGNALSEIVIGTANTVKQGGNKSQVTDEVESFTQEFREVAEVFQKEKKPLLIFVDDLDRCTPVEALDLIDDVKIYLTSQVPIVFVVALDRRTLSMGMRAKYGADVEISVDDYLQKIFSYTVSMPNFTSVQTVVANTLSTFKNKDPDIDLEGIAVQTMNDCGLQNLRSLKRVVRRWAFLTPSNINNFLREAGLPDTGRVECDVQKLAGFCLYLSLLSELYPDFYDSLIGINWRDTGSIPSPDGQAPKGRVTEVYKRYLRLMQFKGIKGDLDAEAERLMNSDAKLRKIVEGLCKSSFLSSKDAEIVEHGYVKCTPTIIESIRLGIPLIK
jgi:hypothetical protein